ncbi:MAG: hypothetical protein M1360_01280 [Candidatus Marsarchaeota archaeon]|nr:hypothetical protein [Candidatus Marsarchaeota archaeon]
MSGKYHTVYWYADVIILSVPFHLLKKHSTNHIFNTTDPGVPFFTISKASFAFSNGKAVTLGPSI